MLHSEKAILLSKYRLEQAWENLNSARKNFEIDELKTANNRAYYCVFHAMRAVIALDEQDFKKHSGIISYFREHYIKTKVFNRQCSDIVSSSSLIRNKSDYDDFYIASKEKADEQLETTKIILSSVEGYLTNKIK